MSLPPPSSTGTHLPGVRVTARSSWFKATALKSHPLLVSACLPTSADFRRASLSDKQWIVLNRPSSRHCPPVHCKEVPGCFSSGSRGDFVVNANTQFLGHLPANPGAQTHVPFGPSLSQVPPFRQLTLAQGSLYNSQCVPVERDTTGVTHLGTCSFPGL